MPWATVSEMNSAGLLQHSQRLLQIDDVDAVPMRDYVLTHPGIPPPLLVAEVDPGFQKGFHCERSGLLGLYHLLGKLSHSFGLLLNPVLNMSIGNRVFVSGACDP